MADDRAIAKPAMPMAIDFLLESIVDTRRKSDVDPRQEVIAQPSNIPDLDRRAHQQPRCQRRRKHVEAKNRVGQASRDIARRSRWLLGDDAFVVVLVVARPWTELD